jgi:GT2 family glycosyltransferase
MAIHFKPLDASPPVCSVCIANYNGAEIIGACIESIIAQTWDFPVEIIVHDDASTDDSVAVIRRDFPFVRVIASTENVGFCISNNRMAEQARGEFILLLNNDAALAPDALATLYRHAQQQAMQGILSLPQYDWQSGQLVDRGCLLDPFYNPVPNLVAHRIEVAMVIGACLWIPKSLWHMLGGFPTWFESIAEDMYLCCRARRAGYPVEVCSTSHYRHWQGKSFSGIRPANAVQLISSYRRRRLSERNKTYTLVVCTPAPWLWLLLPVHLLLLAIEGLVLSAVKRESRIWREIYASAFASLGKNQNLLREARRQIRTLVTGQDLSYQQGFTYFPHKLRLLFSHGWPVLN